MIVLDEAIAPKTVPIPKLVARSRLGNLNLGSQA